MEHMLLDLRSKFARFATRPVPPAAGYHAFTTRFDLEMRAEHLSEVGQGESSSFRDSIAQFEQAIAPWRAIAPAVVTEFVDLVTARNGDPELSNTVASLLIDHSGSMRKRPSIIATVLAHVVAECWSQLGIRYEVLGFTTRSWRGGRPRRHWILAGQPANPGRLCELLHIIYRSADDTCRGAPQSIRNLMRDGLLKENVDGEAVIWAAERLRKRPEKRKVLLVVSDGAPVDDATLDANNGDILHRHLKDVIAGIRQASDIRLAAIGLGHDVSIYYSEGIVITSPDELTGHVLPFLAGLLADQPLTDGRSNL
jgi:cobaltochelatase CobT